MQEQDTPPNSAAVLGRGTLLAFALPAIMLGFMHAPEAQVQGIYAKYAGLSLTALAGALLLTRIFDAVTYPLIGWLTDLTFRRTGSRKAWIVVGTAVTVVGLWFLYRPPPQASIVYFTISMATTYVGWKLTEIPYTAWAMSLSREYVQRARVQLWRTIAQLVGNLVFFSAPFAAKALGLAPDTALNFQTLGLTAVMIAVCVSLMNLYSLWRVPEMPAPPAAAAVSKHPGAWRDVVVGMARNRAMLSLLAALVPMIVCIGMSTGVIYLYLDTYMHLGEKLPLLMLVAVPSSLLGVPFWGWACLRYERHRVWAVSIVATVVAYAGMAFAPVGESGFWILAVSNTLATFCVVALGVAAPAMMGDVIDYDRMQSGEDRAGAYAAALAFLSKSLGGVATAMGLAVLGRFGFDAAAAQQSAQGAFGIRLVMIWLPVAGGALSAPIIWHFPIDRARQAEIREAIRLRENAAGG